MPLIVIIEILLELLSVSELTKLTKRVNIATTFD